MSECESEAEEEKEETCCCNGQPAKRAVPSIPPRSHRVGRSPLPEAAVPEPYNDTYLQLLVVLDAYHDYLQ